jgi:hypothetical protein
MDWYSKYLIRVGVGKSMYPLVRRGIASDLNLNYASGMLESVHFLVGKTCYSPTTEIGDQSFVLVLMLFAVLNPFFDFVEPSCSFSVLLPGPKAG